MGPAPEQAEGPRYRRSPFLLMQWEDERVVVVQADTMRRFRVGETVLRLLARLGDWRPLDDVRSEGPALSADAIDRLVSAGILETQGQMPGEAIYWNPFELAVHRASNTGGYRPQEVRARGTPPPEAVKPRPDGEVTALPPPTGQLEGGLHNVLERRRSIRRYGQRALRLDEVSSLLHHSGRAIRRGTVEGLGGYSLRPYPSGGARSELELYAIANAVDGLDPGAHYYDPSAHELVCLDTADQGQQELNRQVRDATGRLLSRDPPLILVITAVFARVMWKYRGIGLGIIYKNTGCLIENLYLVATSLGLAPCAVGGGRETANSRWLGLDPLVESQVGCFIVGPRSDEEAS